MDLICFFLGEPFSWKKMVLQKELQRGLRHSDGVLEYNKEYDNARQHITNGPIVLAFRSWTSRVILGTSKVPHGPRVMSHRSWQSRLIFPHSKWGHDSCFPPRNLQSSPNQTALTIRATSSSALKKGSPKKASVTSKKQS